MVAVREVSLETLCIRSYTVPNALLAALRLVVISHRHKRALEVEVDGEGRPQCLLELEVLEL